ncbi:MAG: sensor histidine kinase [Clostridiales Family XIII bacterium]|jgi:signal transduction histidine kinase|nr:sensor histidine kinase [Clostridiales Family XIII bacterium]
MKITSFLRGKLLFIALCFFISAFGALLLYTMQANLRFALFVPGFLFGGSVLALLPEYLAKNRYYRELRNAAERLDKKHLLSEIVSAPEFYEGEILYDALKTVGKSANDEIAKHRLVATEYREYIELWVHEIKTPIAVAKLICENTQNADMDAEIDRIERLVEQALFYARSGNVENDYLIRRIDLRELLNDTLKNGAKYLIGRKIRIRTENLSHTVFTDPKWLSFILWQLIDNSVKYGCRNIEFSGVQNARSVSLFIRDDGVGISEKDIGRVFDKGFTGENGRRFGRSTGLGLYLCKKLCAKLGLSLSLESAPGEGVVAELVFPKSEFV